MSEEALLNVAAIYAALDQERQARSMSWRQVATEAGVSPSTLSRMAQGHAPALEGLIKLADWTGYSLDELVGRGASRISADLAPPAAISSYLRSRKELTPQGLAALEAIIGAAYEKLRTDDTP
ncbi:MAG: helix-turn-helix transcriptional regulator [Dehalococcoidia bacterium]